MPNKEHGHTVAGKNNGRYKHGMCGTPEHMAWKGMIARCYRTTHHKFPSYGGRGVQVCDRWRGEDGFINFFNDVGSRPSPNHSLDKDIKGGVGCLLYCPENCQWATRTDQGRHTRGNKLSFEKAEQIRRLVSEGLSYAEVGRRFGVSYVLVREIWKGKLWKPA